jgi:hypothetical protein
MNQPLWQHRRPWLWRLEERHHFGIKPVG